MQKDHYTLGEDYQKAKELLNEQGKLREMNSKRAQKKTKTKKNIKKELRSKQGHLESQNK